MTAREEILERTRAALNRQRNEPIPPVMLVRGPETGLVERFTKALEALAGHVYTVSDAAEAQTQVEKIVGGRTFMTKFSREACATVDVGITGADYALADTGSLVIFTESGESRLLSLLPPCHIAIIGKSKLVASLDDVLRQRPKPGDTSSAMVVITGPSRTADIEMRLVRGVHGPGEIHVVIVEQM